VILLVKGVAGAPPTTRHAIVPRNDVRDPLVTHLLALSDNGSFRHGTRQPDLETATANTKKSSWFRPPRG
jgi:hypothetical protein